MKKKPRLTQAIAPQTVLRSTDPFPKRVLLQVASPHCLSTALQRKSYKDIYMNEVAAEQKRDLQVTPLAPNLKRGKQSALLHIRPLRDTLSKRKHGVLRS